MGIVGSPHSFFDPARFVQRLQEDYQYEKFKAQHPYLFRSLPPSKNLVIVSKQGFLKGLSFAQLVGITALSVVWRMPIMRDIQWSCLTVCTRAR